MLKLGCDLAVLGSGCDLAMLGTGSDLAVLGTGGGGGEAAESSRMFSYKFSLSVPLLPLLYQ